MTEEGKQHWEKLHKQLEDLTQAIEKQSLRKSVMETGIPVATAVQKKPSEHSWLAH